MRYATGVVQQVSRGSQLAHIDSSPRNEGREEVLDYNCGTQLRRNTLLPWASEVVTNGTFMLGHDKVEDMSKLEPGKWHELTLVLS